MLTGPFYCTPSLQPFLFQLNVHELITIIENLFISLIFIQACIVNTKVKTHFTQFIIIDIDSLKNENKYVKIS